MALSKAQLAERAAQDAVAGTSTIEAALHQRKGKSFFLALGLRFGQAGNSGLIQTFLVGYLATALAVSKSVGTDAILIGSLFGFLTVPIVGVLGDRFGRRPLYIAFAIMAMLWAFPMLLMITSADPTLITIGMAVGLNICVLGLFSLESVTLPELFGARTRFTQLALAKEIGGILATAIGPVLAATLVAVTGQWWPLAAMVVGYSAITLVSAIAAPRCAVGISSGWRTPRDLADRGQTRRHEGRRRPCRRGPAGRGPTRSHAGPGEVLIAVEWGGICGSDLGYWKNGASGTAVLRGRWSSGTRSPVGSRRSGRR